MGTEHIISCYLNKRGKSPAAADDLQIVKSYPEPGVIRFYCGGNTKVWVDQVISKSEFRYESKA